MDYKASRYDLIQVAQGKQPADVFLRNGSVVNVYSGEILRCNVAICQDRIAYVGPSEVSIGSDTQMIDCTDRFVVPGYIEPHAHPWVFYNPISLTEKVLPLGTTTIVHDNLFFYLHMGAKGFHRATLRKQRTENLHIRCKQRGLYHAPNAGGLSGMF